MRDLTIKEFADKYHMALLRRGVRISRATSRSMCVRFFKNFENFLESGKGDLIMPRKDICLVVKVFDAKKLCDEFASEPFRFATYEDMLRRDKLTKEAKKFLRFEIRNTLSRKLDTNGKIPSKKKAKDTPLWEGSVF